MKEDLEILAAIEKAKRKALRAVQPRYNKGPRALESIKAYARKAQPHRIEFVFSYDIVERMYQYHMRSPDPLTIPRAIQDLLRMRFITFADRSMPAVLARLDDSSYPEGSKLRRADDGWRMFCTAPTRGLRLRSGLASRVMDYFWWPEERGVVLVFPDDWLVHHGPKQDVRKAFDMGAKGHEPPDAS